MSPGLTTTIVAELCAAAHKAVARMVADRVRRMVDHPAFATTILGQFGLDMLQPSAVAARAEAMLEHELTRPDRGCFELGRARDLRAVIGWARHEMETA